MAKNRPFIPPPRFTPPDAPPDLAKAAAMAEEAIRTPIAEAHSAVELTAPALTVVAPPARVASVKILPDRIEFANPMIELTYHVWLKHAAPHIQTAILTPDRAVVAHGMIVIEEFRLSIPVEGARFRT